MVAGGGGKPLTINSLVIPSPAKVKGGVLHGGFGYGGLLGLAWRSGCGVLE